MPVPLAIAAPAAIAGLSYINAKTSFSYDWRLLGSAVDAQIRGAIREKKDKLSTFYLLESHALGNRANHPLLIFEGRSYTYKEVYNTALKYGQWLKNVHGIKPKEIVAMDFMNSDKFIFIWMGLWAIGAKPAFINYNLSGKALVHCIRVAKANLVLIDPQVSENVTQEVQNELDGIRFEVFTPEIEARILTMQPKREPDEVRSDDKIQNMAIVIFTSGTTGLPKGAIVSWRKIIVGSGLVPGWMSFTKNDVFYTSMPLYHSSASVLGFCTTLTAGATYSLGKKFSTKTFWEDVRSTNATTIQYVGETCRYLLSAPSQFSSSGENLDRKNNVRLAFGNGLRPDIWNRFKERFGIEAIAEFYTATESTSANWNYSRNDFSKGAVGRIGTLGSLLLGGTLCMVELDWDTEQPRRSPTTGLCIKVPKGSPGELLYQLDPLDIERKFQGYFGNKGSTEGKIMRDVLEKGDAWFRTGDMMMSDSEGRTFFSDRIGDTFRWKSENVSTSEVSEAFGTHPLVAEANVYGVELPHHDGRAGCVALVLKDEPTEKSMRELANHVYRELPRFAVPVFLRLTKQMILTGTNKQQKHVIRAQGVDPKMMGEDELWWARDGTYVRFSEKDWRELNGGKVRL
ncbi:related to FAT1-very long-chain fatty acyl-CoA synthetase [Rhynchosporium agropyri]|uniref:Very long-chain fatty acid transport protein n=1 Tax=Rhynchosporium agropyri TaxID=914238 RepID=A0A1E1KIN8_9HELO|nr:related to FAT1-very long-chain fatty acyl-CoA synthetase [Rhynchosporium agropyri]